MKTFEIWIRTETGERLAFTVSACSLACAICEVLRQYPETVSIAAQQPEQMGEVCCR